MSRFESQWAARRMAFIRHIDASDLPKDTGATSTGSLISGDFGGDTAGASRQVRNARNLAKATLTEKALAAGDQIRADVDEELTFGQRLGRAFCHWIEKIPTDGLPVTGGTPATLTINLDYNTLAGQVREAAGTRATGERISASEIRRLACTAGILPRVLDGKSQPLDQGRTKRIYTPPQRMTLADRDLGCTYPGCDRPPSWTEAHHLDHWARDDGPTTLDNAALLCARHHHFIHSENIHGRIRDNHVQFQLNGIWQTNHRWRP